MSDPTPAAEKHHTRMPGPGTIVALTLLGVMILCSLGGVLITTIPDSETGKMSLTPLPGFLGMILAALSTGAMILFRKKDRPDSARLAVSLMLWLVGVIVVGWGGAAAMSPGEMGSAANLGWTTIFCFGPGFLMAMLGMGLYVLDQRGGWPFYAIETDAAPASTKVQTEADRQLQRAAEYRRRIQQTLDQQANSAFASQLAPIGDRLDEWEDHLRELVNRQQIFETDSVIQRDMKQLPAAIKNLEAGLENESDPGVQAQMQDTLESYREQQRHLTDLGRLMRRTQLEVYETLADMGSIYSQLQMLDARDIDSQRARRLSDDITQQTRRLSDLLSAMDEVYQESAG